METESTYPNSSTHAVDTGKVQTKAGPVRIIYKAGLLDSIMVEAVKLDPSLMLDLRYATANNVTGEPIYDCARCYLREEVAEALIRVQQYLQPKGLGLKLFDCYRPHSVQQKLWNKVPDKNYVTDPSRGSMHNRGLAVDLTLVDSTGAELDMGTSFDHFGREANHYYSKLSPEAVKNRALLREAMKKGGFMVISAEWWHYSYRGRKWKIYDIPIPCEH